MNKENEEYIFVYGDIKIIKSSKLKNDEAFRIKTGMYENRVWIERRSGEGGDFDASEFYDLIEKFYNERL